MCGARSVLSDSSTDEAWVMPNLIGRVEPAAERALPAGTTVRVSLELSDEPEGTVISQSIEAGSMVEQTTIVVTVTVSEHPNVPRLTGLLIRQARAILQDRSLRLGTMKRRASELAEGVIIAQSVRQGKELPAGSRVDVTIVDPHVCGFPLNPWCYTTQGGSLIYDAPLTFCSLFDCISSFWDSTNGYIIQCANGEYSHPGGVQGSCSYNGGNARPLYRP